MMFLFCDNCKCPQDHIWSVRFGTWICAICKYPHIAGTKAKEIRKDV